MNKLMNLAWEEAMLGVQLGDYPIGAVMVCDDGHIIKAHNERNTQKDKKKHAEINLIDKCIYRTISNKIIYVTLEPCEMCSLALKNFGVNEIHYIVSDPVHGGTHLLGADIKIVKYPDEWGYLQFLLDFFPHDLYPEHRKYFLNTDTSC